MWISRLFRGLLLFLAAFIISNCIIQIKLDKEIARIAVEDQQYMCESREITIKTRIEYAFKSLMIAQSLYDDAILEEDSQKSIVLLLRSEQFCYQALGFYPYEHYSYVLLEKIYTRQENTPKYELNSKELRKIEDEYYQKKPDSVQKWQKKY